MPARRASSELARRGHRAVPASVGHLTWAWPHRGLPRPPGWLNGSAEWYASYGQNGVVGSGLNHGSAIGIATGTPIGTVRSLWDGFHTLLLSSRTHRQREAMA
jgi:hypothetical protein